MTSKSKENKLQEVKNFYSIKTNSIKTDGSKTNHINQNEAISVIRRETADAISLEILEQRHPAKRDIIRELYELMVEVLASNKPTIRAAKEDWPAESVKEVFRRLDSSHVEYVVECLSANTTEVRSTKAYLTTALFNAAKTMSNHYSLSVQRDLYNNEMIHI